ncbi:MAG: type II secretion system F family protein [archaeon]
MGGPNANTIHVFSNDKIIKTTNDSIKMKLNERVKKSIGFNLVQSILRQFHRIKRKIEVRREQKKDANEKKLAEKPLDTKDFLKHKGKQSKKKRRSRKNLNILKEYLVKAGFESVDERHFSGIMKKFAVIFCFVFSIVIVILMIMSSANFWQILLYLLSIWTFIFVFALVILWVIVYMFLDIKIFQRTQQLEDVLPDFLQLASANMSAGMAIDQALWFAVRPKFGVLANEIEEVAKSTIAGVDLSIALTDLSNKYDSPMLRRTVNLLIEGMNAGGQLAELLSKIVVDIQEMKLMKREISASIMTYVIFITFASIVAAPFLFALSTQLIVIVQKIMGSIDLSEMASGGFQLALGGEAVSLKNFRIFAILTLSSTAMFSAAIVSTIRHGNIKEGLKYLPIFWFIAVLLYLIASSLVGTLMSGFI